MSTEVEKPDLQPQIDQLVWTLRSPSTKLSKRVIEEYKQAWLTLTRPCHGCTNKSCPGTMFGMFLEHYGDDCKESGRLPQNIDEWPDKAVRGMIDQAIASYGHGHDVWMEALELDGAGFTTDVLVTAFLTVVKGEA